MKTYKPSELPNLLRPIVYGWRRGDQYLYIGKSKRGTSRIVDGNVLRFHVEEGDVVDIWKATLQNVDHLEIKFIRKFNPKYNIFHSANPSTYDTNGTQICTLCQTKIIPPRSNQRFCSSTCRVVHWKQNENPASAKMKEYKKLLREIDKTFKI